MNVLQEADKLVHGDRNEAYGHPLDDFGCTAAIWRAMIKRRYGLDVPVDPDFVGLCMAAVKLSRESGKHKTDNLIDLAGYAETTQMCVDEIEARAQSMGR